MAKSGWRVVDERKKKKMMIMRKKMEEENSKMVMMSSGSSKRRKGEYENGYRHRYGYRDGDDHDHDVYDDDPMEVLGEDIMMKIMGNLDARSLARSLLVSRSWFSVSSSDSLWSPLKYTNGLETGNWKLLESGKNFNCLYNCDDRLSSEKFPNPCKELWKGKAHIPRWSKVPGISELACYSRAVIDSKRIRIMKEDLCHHSWDFHFTEAAPDYWKSMDPYWGGLGPPMHRYFHPDGSQTADPEDKVWGGHECTYTIVTSVIGDGKIRENYVRINHWPRLVVSRRDDWGWEMSNVIFAYSSVPDAEKEGGTGPMLSFR